MSEEKKDITICPKCGDELAVAICEFDEDDNIIYWFKGITDDILEACVMCIKCGWMGTIKYKFISFEAEE